jgi:hypothetical protein
MKNTTTTEKKMDGVRARHVHTLMILCLSDSLTSNAATNFSSSLSFARCIEHLFLET